ncbi:Na/H antiporter [Ascobolus immersus RN42]|uniref:Na/H antiporter n=1 Tax=Ascobolus immersus RN42 TaxID=1160509 RepID=A0A3N4J2N0_ASCIM|nr:Na/H antiporter [Ascobolus immersus RN42]
MPQLHLTSFNIACSVFGGFFLIFNLVSSVLKDHLYLSDSLNATVIGIALGPLAARLIRPYDYGKPFPILIEFARLLLGVQLVLTGIQLPKRYIRDNWWSLSMLLVPVMTVSWLISSTILYLLIPDFHYLHAMILGACLTPTDPILSNAVIVGKYARQHTPQHTRLIISAESGANDGFGYPYLYLALYLTDYPTGRAIGVWFYEAWAYTILLSVVYGVLVAWLGQYLLRKAAEKQFADIEGISVFGIVLAVFLIGTCGLLGIDDLLACFAAGNVFTWNDWFRKITRDDSLQTTMDYVLTASFFAYYGATLPWPDFDLEHVPFWRFFVSGILVLVFKRIPPLIAFYKAIPAVRKFKEALFVGHFGPVGVGAIYYAGIALEHLHQKHGEDHITDKLSRGDRRLLEILGPFVLFTVLLSVVIHGLSIPVFMLVKNIPIVYQKGPRRWLEHYWRPDVRMRLLEWKGSSSESDEELGSKDGIGFESSSDSNPSL